MSDICPTGSPDEYRNLLRWNEQGLVPVVAQERDTGEVLMVAWANEEALQQTLETQVATYFSRSRNQLWVKGESSGYTQQIHEIRTDCDGDVLLYSVSAPGPACHQLRRSCFSHKLHADGSIETDKPVIA